MDSIQIKRGNMDLYQVKPDDDSAQVKQVMGDSELRINFKEVQHIPFKIGDKAFVFDEWYYLNRLPEITKISSKDYSYSMTMVSTTAILARAQYLFLGSDNSLKEGQFSLTGKAIDFINLLIQNTKRLLPDFEFTTGQVNDSDYKTLSFSTENCLEALGKIAEAFETEYWVEGMRVHLTAIGRDTGFTFKQGKRKGLYELNRKTVNNQTVITRLYAFGSEKNLPENYRNFSKRLKLPSQGTKTITNVTWTIVNNGDGTETYTFNWDPPQVSDQFAVSGFYMPVGSVTGFIGLTQGPVNSPRVYILPVGEYQFVFRTDTPRGDRGEYFTPFFLVTLTSTQPAVAFAGEVIFVEKNVDKYGVSESTIFFDDIYPHRTGTVSGINAGDVFEFTDIGVDFDVNDYLLQGITAKVTFNTGQLAGYTFEVKSFDDAFKRFQLLKNRYERTTDIPNNDLKPAIGDKYVLTDIKMPQNYIDEAEAALFAAANAELGKLSEPQLSYSLLFDPVFVRDRGYNIKLGDLIWIVDEPLEVQRKMRVVNIQRNIVNEFDYSVEIADALRTSLVRSLASGQGAISQNVSTLASNVQNNSINNNRVIGDLIMTGDASIIFENLPVGTGLTPIGIDANGKIYKI